MNSAIYRMLLDIQKTMSQISIPVNKHDKYRSLYITLTENGTVYEIVDGCYAFFDAKKPDGTFIHNACRIEGNTIVYDLTTQTTAAVGLVECEIVLYDSDPIKNSNAEKITTPRFSLIVDEIIYNGEEIVSTPEADALKDLVEEARAVISGSEGFVGRIDEHRQDQNNPHGVTAEQIGSPTVAEMNSAISDAIGAAIGGSY